MVALSYEPLDLQIVLKAVESPLNGGSCFFLGTVRSHTNDIITQFLEYSAYEEMALKQMEAIAQQAVDRFGGKAAMVHRLGKVNILETAVICSASTPHRAEAFECCRFLIDSLKNEVAIWKKEYQTDGAFWIEGLRKIAVNDE